eukprot:4759007-Pyramimonas_sp.AAC.1
MPILNPDQALRCPPRFVLAPGFFNIPGGQFSQNEKLCTRRKLKTKKMLLSSAKSPAKSC